MDIVTTLARPQSVNRYDIVHVFVIFNLFEVWKYKDNTEINFDSRNIKIKICIK